MHGDAPEVIAEKIADMRERREREGLPPLQYGMAAYAIVRDSEAEAEREVARITDMGGKPPPGFDNFEQWITGTQLERELKVQEYSVSNRGLRPRLIGTPEQIREKIGAYEAVGLDLLLLQMSPQEAEMERFSAQVIRPPLTTERSRAASR
jgi:FMNH2-dependent dimethyl sulfone monooxygenase